MKNQFFVMVLLSAAGVAYSASSDAQHIKYALHSIDAILAEKANFTAAPDVPLEPIIQYLETAKSVYQKGDIRTASRSLLMAKDRGLFVTVNIPDRGEYRLAQMITAIFFDGDPFAPTIE